MKYKVTATLSKMMNTRSIDFVMDFEDAEDEKLCYDTTVIRAVEIFGESDSSQINISMRLVD